METLEKKHLANYLPHRLMIRDENGVDVEMTGLNSGVIMINHDTNGYAAFDEIKLILYPLDWLTKPIEHNGEKFVPLKRLQHEVFITDYCYDWEVITEQLDEAIMLVPFEIIQKLIEWHFNIFDIPKHLYIDKSTLKDNERY